MSSVKIMPKCFLSLKNGSAAEKISRARAPVLGARFWDFRKSTSVVFRVRPIASLNPFRSNFFFWKITVAWYTESLQRLKHARMTAERFSIVDANMPTDTTACIRAWTGNKILQKFGSHGKCGKLTAAWILCGDHVRVYFHLHLGEIWLLSRPC